ncbi:MAG: MBOAT family protein, partial [Candidatus Aminicenantes bacterium]|nr:MBOAT family protein [Candidatus Aminicenantes bacterium]
LENFNYPYMARSVKDFWRRWHISLAKWLRDYLFLPIAYAVSRKIKSPRFLRIKAEDWAYYTGSFVTMFICGLWHGANWTFVFWGVFYGTFLILEHAGLGKRLKHLWWPFRILYTQFLVMVAWVFFRSDSFSYALQYLKAMFGFGTGDGTAYYPALYVHGEIVVFGILGLVLSTPLISKLKASLKKEFSKRELWFQKWLVQGYRTGLNLGLFLIFIFSIMALASGTYNPFIYFRF